MQKKKILLVQKFRKILRQKCKKQQEKNPGSGMKAFSDQDPE
jgi:hypothetical protein